MRSKDHFSRSSSLTKVIKNKPDLSYRSRRHIADRPERNKKIGWQRPPGSGPVRGARFRISEMLVAGRGGDGGRAVPLVTAAESKRGEHGRAGFSFGSDQVSAQGCLGFRVRRSSVVAEVGCSEARR
nr:unnamed protein product [Digitaria exilis]